MAEDKIVASAIIKEIGTLYTAKVRRDTEAIGAMNSYRPLLTQLYIKDGGTQLSLADRTGIKAPTVSITLRKMEKEGLVKRVVDESDLRKTHVYLTDKGRMLTENMNRCVVDANDVFTNGMTDEQKEFFLNSLVRIREELKK